jgi:RNA polymerase sigma factor (TIGR02999 family)
MTHNQDNKPPVTDLLRRIAQGDAAAPDALYRAVYDDLHRIARKRLYESGSVGVLDSPGLVSEAYMRMVGKEGALAENRRVFFAYAAKVMRSIILDAVREQHAEKRGSGEADVTLYTGVAGISFRNDQLESLEQALLRLARIDQRACNIVELRYFGGFTMDECAEQEGISVATAARVWERARVFLASELAS